jgi:hypothetical protein
MEYTNQQVLDICDRMPDELKKCGVTTGPDGTGTVDLGDFIINYGRALIADIETNKQVSGKGRGRKGSKSVPNEV